MNSQILSRCSNSKAAMKSALVAFALLAATSIQGSNCAFAQAASAGANAALNSQVPEQFRKGLTSVYDPQYPPSYYMNDNNEMAGYVIDFEKAIAAKLGIPVREEQAKFSGIVAGILGGRYDMSAFQETAERREKMDFAEITQSGTSVLVRTGNPHKLDYYELCGHKIGSVQGSGQYLEVLPKLQAKCKEKSQPEIDVLVFPGPNEGTLALKTGRIEAWLDGAPYAGYIVKNSTGEFEKTKTSDVSGISGFAFKKGSPMAEPFKRAIQSMMDDGSYRKLMADWQIPELSLEKATINGQ